MQSVENLVDCLSFNKILSGSFDLHVADGVIY